MPPSISLVHSRTKGVPTAIFRRTDGREFYLHSRYDPVEEARFLVEDVPRQERTLYAVLGFGLGYHVKALLQRTPQSSHIIVMEPDSARLSSSLLKVEGSPVGTWMHDSRLHFFSHHDASVAPLSLTDRLANWRLLSLKVITHIPSTLTDESFYRALLTEIPQRFPAAFQSRLNLLDKMLESSLRNFWANLPHTWSAAPVESLQGVWSGRPLIIVSAGPSLTGALPLLSKAGGSVVLLAIGAAARILMSRQIQPDLVISYDPFEASQEHFKGWDTSAVPLIYYHRTFRGVLTLHSGPKFFFVMNDEPPIPLSRSAEKSDFRHGGSVAFSALQLAHHLDANPVIFVGQDFAFANGHTHADGCVVDQTFNPDSLPPDYFLVPGVTGNPVITSRILHSYLLYMQDYLLDFARLKPHVRHINTSQIGARMRGMDYAPLEKVLESHGAPARPSPRESIASALEQHEPIPQKARKEALDRWIGELERLVQQAGRLSDFDRLFAAFKACSLYTQAARSYDDVYYLYETRYRGDTAAAFPTRFKEHLRFVLEELRRIRAGV